MKSFFEIKDIDIQTSSETLRKLKFQIAQNDELMQPSILEKSYVECNREKLGLKTRVTME